MHLRTDSRVIDFIDCEAVKKAQSSTTLTLDAVFLEIEKDEKYDAEKAKKADEINHKEFLTWREFLDYFNDYQEMDIRNRKFSEIQQSKKSVKRDGLTKEDADEQAANEFKSLMETEKERRLKDLPKLRQADIIEVSEKQL